MGLTALVVLALKHADVPLDHPALDRGIQYILQNSGGDVYSESLVICALEKVYPEICRGRIKVAVRYLTSAQALGGGWSYGYARTDSDNSNSQFAVLGLAAAERCGFEIPAKVKRRAVDHWLRTQTADGGWPYDKRSQRSYLSMTCAGIASLHLLGRRFERPLQHCGDYEADTRFDRGLKAMLRQVPELPVSGYRESYSLYALERVGMFLDLKELDGLDWYRWGAARILGSGRRRTISDYAFDLLFLAKGEAQVAIAKWMWNGDWNNDHQDVKNWVARAGEDLEMKLDWLPARLDSRGSPIAKASLLFANGHEAFSASGTEVLRLKEFLANQGTVVVEGCCGSKVFIDSFKGFVRKQLYPERSIEFTAVGEDHPVCRQKYTLRPDEVSALQVSTGCHKRRILILTSDISCALSGEPANEEEMTRSRKLCVNLLEWAMRSKQPEGKLAVVELAGESEDAAAIGDEEPNPEARTSRRFRQAFGRLVHRGEWDVDPSFFPTLRRVTAKSESVPQFDGEVFVKPASGEHFGCALLYITGHDDPNLHREEWLPLRRYLQNGGRIVSTACCGFERFDLGLRDLLRRVLPNDQLEPVPEDDAVWLSPFSRKSMTVEVSRGYRKKYGEHLAPLYGIRRKGRWIVLYSPVDLCCDLEGDLDEETVAYKSATSVPVWVNLLNYLFSP